MSTPNPHHEQDAAILLSRTYVFVAFGDHWPGVAFLILALTQRSQQLVREVRRAFLLTITVTDSESLLPEVPELPNLKCPSAE